MDKLITHEIKYDLLKRFMKKNAFFITVPWHLKSLAVCANAAQGRRGLWVIGSNQTGQMRVLTSETKLFDMIYDF